MTVQPGLCGTWSETPKTGFLTTRLIFPILLKVDKIRNHKNETVTFYNFIFKGFEISPTDVKRFWRSSFVNNVLYDYSKHVKDSLIFIIGLSL